MLTSAGSPSHLGFISFETELLPIRNNLKALLDFPGMVIDRPSRAHAPRADHPRPDFFGETYGRQEGSAYEQLRSLARWANGVNLGTPETVTEANDARSAQRRPGSGTSPCYSAYYITLCASRRGEGHPQIQQPLGRRFCQTVHRRHNCRRG